MTKPRLPVRPDLADLEPYVSPQLPARHRMNTNESPFPPPPALMDEVAAALDETRFNRYPDRDAVDLYGALARYLDVDPASLWVANGSNEVFLHLFLAFGGRDRTVLVYEPTYSLHTLIPRISGTKVVTADREVGSWIAPVEALETHRPDIVVFCSPNNPTGALESTASIVAALESAPLVIVDEAYVEFAAEGSSLLAQRERHPNLVVTRSFSKAWSMAGVRLGYLVADAGVVSEMARVRLPYSLSTFSQLMGVAALRHADEARSAISSILVERNRIATGLAQLGVGTFPTDANFVLFELEDEGEGARTRAEKIWRALLEREVLVRNYSSSPALAACLRVTASSAEDTDAFLEALEEVL